MVEGIAVIVLILYGMGSVGYGAWLMSQDEFPFQSKILTWRTLIVTIIFLPMAIIVTVLMILLGMIVTGLEKLDTPVFKERYED